MAVSVIPMLSLPVAAVEESTYTFGENVLQNPEPTSSEAWELNGCSYGKFLDMGNDEPYIFGAKRGGDISVRQRVTLTAADVYRANNGELTLEASGKFYAQGSRNLTANLNIICYNSSDVAIATYNAKDSGYSVTGRTKTLKIAKSSIPAGTAYIVYEGTEHLGSGSAYYGMYDFSLIFRDRTNPTLVNGTYLHSVNGNTVLPAYAAPGDKVTYAFEYSEAVNSINGFYPTVDLSIENGVDYDITFSSDRRTVYLTTTLSNTGENMDLVLKSLATLSVADDAGNVCSYADKNLSVGSIPYRSMFSVTAKMVNMLFYGSGTVRFEAYYSATLKPKSGYKLPQNITIKVGGTTISNYDYNPSSGRMGIYSAAVTGNIEIFASAEPQTYTVSLDSRGGSGGTESVSATYLSAMPAITPPARDGYTFGGYFTEIDGGGTKYYEYDGNPTRNYDIPGGLQLYAKWTPKNYTVTLDASGGDGGGTVTAVYDADMPVISKPTRKGYTFLGYYTQPGGEGEMYYNSDGTSAKKYDKTDGLALYANWSANSYTVSFDMCGGNGGAASVDVIFDSKVPTVTPPVREGYTFGGYFAGADGSGAQYIYANGEGTKAYDIDADCTLYAKWTANTYDVVLNAQGGSGGSTVTAVFGSDMPVIAAPDKPGYLFGGYFENPNGSGKKYYNADCSSASVYDRADRITLYALWTPITYNIQLYSRGENVGTMQNVVYGELRLPSAEKIGISYPNYNFVGWNIYDEQNWAMYTSGRTYAAGLAAEQGKTAYIYAAWLEKDKYTITYDANGGEGAPSASEVHTDETIKISGTVPNRRNYTFAGWSEKSDSAEAQYQPNDDFTMGNSLVTLFAVWHKNPELVYNANGGAFTTYAGASYPPAGSSVSLTDAVPQREGYIFCGWAESSLAAKADVVSAPYTMPNRDTILYAVWEPVKYAVSVSVADGYSVSGINADGYVLGEYAEFTVSGSAPKVYVNGILTHPTDGVYKIEIKGAAYVVVSDATSVNIIYNANGGINPPIDMRIYVNGDSVLVKSDLPSKIGYSFCGWASSADSEFAEYKGGDTVAVGSEDIVLYAVWEPILYTVRYDADGGIGSMPATSAVYDKKFTLSENAFAKSGCQFAGWSYSPNGEIAYINGAAVKNLTDIQNGNITLYAVWRGAKTKVNFHFEGGSSGSASCEAVYGKPLPSGNLTAPYRYGYTFAGYYTSADRGGNLVYDSDMQLSDYYKTAAWNSVEEKFDLYAAWEPINYTVTFVNGTKTLGSVSAVYGSGFRIPKADTLGISVPEGYTFCGWSVASGSDTVYYSDGQEITAGLAGENGASVYLYAVIGKNESHTVTLPESGEGYKVYYDDTEVTSQKDITVSKGNGISFKICVENGYTADKMTVSANGIMLGSVQINGAAYTYRINSISADTSINIYHVKKETFHIILNDGTGYSISPNDTVIESGGDFTFKVALADGYKTAVPVVFANGNTLNGTKNGDVFTYTLHDITSQPVISVSVTAKPQHTVTFVSNGSIYLISTVEENMKALQPGIPQRNGYSFAGWYTDASYAAPYDFQTEVTADIRLYAKWTAKSYAVEYNKNTSENIAVPSVQTKKYDNVLILSSQIPVRTGYTFSEWNTKADGTGTSYRAGSELSVNADITLYAQWKINKYSVALITGEGVSGTLSSNEAVYNGTVNVTAASGEGYNSPVITVIPKDNAEVISEGAYRIKGPVSFVAAAEAKKIHTASFYFDGGLYYTQSAIEGNAAAIVLPNPPVKEGSSFIGWYSERTGGTKIDETTVLDKNISVYARFAVNALNITPPGSGKGYTVESGGSTAVNYGGDYTFKITVAEHYNADNMKVYANGILLTGTKVEGTYVYSVKNITADQIITVSGVTADIYAVKYTVDGELYYSERVMYNSKTQKPRTPEKSGYTFSGWFDGDNEWNFADGVKGDLQLEAKFEKNTYTVKVPDNRSEFTVNVISDIHVEHGGTFSFGITVSDGYNASDISVYANGVLLEKTSESGSTLYFDITNVTESKVITVRGIGLNTYSVTYNSNATEYVGNMPENIMKAYDTDVKLSDRIPERYGYKFIGWATSPDGAAGYFAGDMYSENSDVRFYAVWEAMVYSVAFETNGGFVNSGKITEYTYGTGALLPTDVSKDGYHFAGWYEDELLEGARVYEIKNSDCGDKKYYAAYTPADITVEGYTGEYDGKTHDITYTLADNISVKHYQWYFVPSGSNEAIPVSSASYNSYSVKNVAESGEYYCCVDASADGHAARFFTEKATVSIGKRAVSVKAASKSKVYDAQPLLTNETELSGSLADNHTLSAVMTAESVITNVGTGVNIIERIAVSDSEGADVTENYEITQQTGTLSVTPFTLSISAKNARVAAGSVVYESRLYEIAGVLGNENLSPDNLTVTVKNSDNEDVRFSEISKNPGTYTVTINYSGFKGEGSENYQGSGAINSTVTVYRQSNSSGEGGSGMGGGAASLPSYMVDFEVKGGSEIESQSVKAGKKAEEPETPVMEGYIFDGWYSDSALTEEFDFTAEITENIILYAKWTECRQNDEPQPENPVKTGVADLLETDSHISYISGYDDNTFRPEGNMTRAEAAQLFYNLLVDRNVSGDSAFDDVSPDAWYFDAVTALANLGIIKGIGETKFNPEGKITRAEFVAIAMRFVDADVDGVDVFFDVADDYWAAKDISKAAALGWISGNGDGTFSPELVVKRASVVKIVNNMLGRTADIDYINTYGNSVKQFSDVSPSEWYWGDVIEAANAHEYEKSGSAEKWK